MDSPSVENVISSIKRGRVFVSQSPSGPILGLKAYSKPWVFETGETVNAKPGEVLKTLVEAQDGDGATLRLITSQRVEEAILVNRKSFRRVRELRLERNHIFIRAELGWYADPYSVNLGEGDTVLALTNPIYFRTD
ncbi:MAG: hypothetical protein QW334_00720 [Thermofilum sp.]